MARKSGLSSNTNSLTGNIAAGTHLRFTDRERTILQLITDGLSNREIAERLTLSPTTVKWYVKQIFNKLGANRRTEAVKIAADLHVVEFTSSDSDPSASFLVPLNTLIGRETEVADVIGLLDDSAIRLVTVVGVGGIGKTRLVLEVAQRQMSAIPGQVCFVGLDSVNSLSGMIQAVASGIGFLFHGSLEIGRQLLGSLRNRKLVLILDNFEHLLESTPFVNEMLMIAPRLKILITSRERLHLSTETVYAVHGLDFPLTADHIEDHAAFRLFMQVARYSQPTFRPTTEDILHISRICQLVEGMPLAIELASKWVDILTPAEIEAEIVKGIGILQTDWQDLPERHRSIRAVFERSWQLLSDDEREAFKKLCIFVGGFDRSAAERVTGATLFMVSKLVDQSLLTRIGKDRYKLHELVRQFAEEKLKTDRNEYTLILDKHCQYFGDLMESYEKKIKFEVSAMADSVMASHDNYNNILAGWQHALNTPLLPEIGKYVFTISGLFQSRGLNSEAEQTFAQALRLLETNTLLENDPTRVRLMTHYGWFLQSRNHLELACQVLQSAVEFSVALDHSHTADVGLLLGFLASALTLNNQLEAGRKNAQQGLETCQAANFQFGVWLCLTILAQVEHSEGRHETAYDYHHQALIHAEKHRNLYGTIQSLGHLSCICWALGNVKETLAYVQQDLSLMRSFFMVDHLFLTILAIAGVHEQRGQPDAALELLAMLLHHPQSGTPLLGPTVGLLLLRLQSQLSMEQINNVMKKAKQGQLSSRYLDPNFTVGPELVERLSVLLSELVYEKQ